MSSTNLSPAGAKVQLIADVLRYRLRVSSRVVRANQSGADGGTRNLTRSPVQDVPFFAARSRKKYSVVSLGRLKQTSEPGVSAVKADETELLPDSIAGFPYWSTSHGPALYKSQYQHRCLGLIATATRSANELAPGICAVRASYFDGDA